MSTLSKLSIVTFAIGLIGGLSNCNKTKDIELQNIKDINLQISSFGLASATDSTLSRVSFSIKNNIGEGEISNDVPLPYQTSLEKVTIPMRTSAIRTSIAIGDGNFEPWSATKSYNIPSNVRELRIKLVYKEDLSSDSLTYTYKVKLRQYTSNPEAITWTEDKAYNNNAFPSSGKLPSGVKIERIAEYESLRYALGEDESLYQYNKNSWAKLSNISGVQELLGIYPNGSKEASVIVKLANNQIANYTANTLQATKIKLPTGFPQQILSLNSFSSYTEKLEGGKVKLITVTPSGLVQSWFYTGNNTIAKEAQQALNPDQTFISSDVVFLDQTYYLFASTGNGIQIYSSTDGNTWKKNSPQSLLGLDTVTLNKEEKIHVAVIDGKYYLLVTGQSNRVFSGTPHRKETNF
ncbi:MAG: DUF6242 domain-containing protein [Porphyromonas sp.]